MLSLIALGLFLFPFAVHTEMPPSPPATILSSVDPLQLKAAQDLVRNIAASSSTRLAMHVMTDKTICKPGDTLHWRGFASSLCLDKCAVLL